MAAGSARHLHNLLLIQADQRHLQLLQDSGNGDPKAEDFEFAVAMKSSNAFANRQFSGCLTTFLTWPAALASGRASAHHDTSVQKWTRG